MTPPPEPEAPAIDAPAIDAMSTRTRRSVARWRPSRALLGVVVALLASQAVAVAVQLAGDGGDPKAWVLATSLVLGDISLLGLSSSARDLMTPPHWKGPRLRGPFACG
jgi:hypothetical protein